MNYTSLKRRVKELEEKAWIDNKETQFLIIRWETDEPDCKALVGDNLDLCPEYQKFKLNPEVAYGVAIFWPPCNDCKEPVRIKDCLCDSH